MVKGKSQTWDLWHKGDSLTQGRKHELHGFRETDVVVEPITSPIIHLWFQHISKRSLRIQARRDPTRAWTILAREGSPKAPNNEKRSKRESFFLVSLEPILQKKLNSTFNLFSFSHSQFQHTKYVFQFSIPARGWLGARNALVKLPYHNISTRYSQPPPCSQESY